MNDNENKVQEKDLLNNERISRFMQGQMTSFEEAAFLEELNSNEEFRNQAIAQARLVKGMKQVDDELKDVFHHTDEQTIRRIAKETVGYKNHSARWLAIAASLVFVVFVGFKTYDYYDTTSLGREYANTFPISTIIRGETNTDVETELAILFNNVLESKDLDNTTSRLATLWELSKQDTYNDYTDYAPYIGWYLAIGYLENYEKVKAKNILIKMSQEYPERTVIGDKVRDLMIEIS